MYHESTTWEIKWCNVSFFAEYISSFKAIFLLICSLYWQTCVFNTTILQESLHYLKYRAPSYPKIIIEQETLMTYPFMWSWSNLRCRLAGLIKRLFRCRHEGYRSCRLWPSLVEPRAVTLVDTLLICWWYISSDHDTLKHREISSTCDRRDGPLRGTTEEEYTKWRTHRLAAEWGWAGFRC